ncbi:MAG: hypothetical protein B6D70_02175 [gamma proteobacterium symbiont of Stewartia floridana]|nr:hypothetical protein [Candidatus Thiodiazotropha taylori]RLW52487.1 MAG: hypothetical protein B6D69_06990 [gamma proteobacterium symbiont of Stewartia floridana]RLW53376.1 MAG: hypothetical protein B6D76_11870 [gamma proteobacterium symbiont of Stewartia floridana]RLW60220.1 MAG: hypothetical protein B6D75_06260 [gamma proteobacterium symbiont of Stewartia floridana]RLW67356.1 MAG: hypothetical protein B6D70_02175 [gamma proteobacterium symbiont of Stewartia floridana]
MPPEKLIEKLFRLLDPGRKKLKSERIRDLLKKMKKQERAAKSKLKKTKNKTKHKRLATKIKILHTQRKKAIKRYRQLTSKC